MEKIVEEAKYTYRRNEYQQCIGYANEGLRLAKDMGDKQGEARACGLLAWSYYWCGDYEGSIKFGKESLCTAKDAGNRLREEAAAGVLARSYYMVGDYKQSIEYGRHSLSITVKDLAKTVQEGDVGSVPYELSPEYSEKVLSMGNKVREEHACCVLAWSYFRDGDFNQSIYYGKQSLSIAKELGGRGRQAAAGGILAWSYYRVGDFKQSIEYGKQSLGIAKERGLSSREDDASRVLAWSYFELKDYTHSIEYSEQSLLIAKRTRDRVAEADACGVLAWSYYEVGDYEKSIKYGNQSVSNANEEPEVEQRVRIADAYGALAWSYYKLGCLEQSVQYGKQSLKIAMEKGNRVLKAEACRVLAWCYLLLGDSTQDYTQSIEYGKQSLTIAKETENKLWEAEACRVLARSYCKVGDFKQSKEHGSQLLIIAKEEGNKKVEAEAYDILMTSHLLDSDVRANEFEGTMTEAETQATGGLTNISSAVCPGFHPGTDTDYNMTAIPRGITLIVNNKIFAGKADKTRHGSQEDVRQIEALFAALGFEVRKRENLSRLHLLDELDDVACQDHSAYDCFVLWLMSHGRSGEVLCSDGNTIPVQTLHDMMSECDTLSGKPKLFFIQACRGDKEDQGVSVACDTGHSSNKDFSPNQVDSPIDAVKKPSPRVPKHADFLYAFSTVDEYVSYRDKALGGYYVRGVVEALRERAVHDHLLDILTVVNQKVSENEIKRLKQMPEVNHTLRKKVRF